MSRQIRRNLLNTTALNIFTYLVPLMVIPYFVRIAGAENFGTVNITQSIVQYLILFVGFNLDISVSGEVAIYKNDNEKLRKIFWQTVYSRLLLLVLATIVFLVIFIGFVVYDKNAFLLAITFLGVLGYAITPIWFYQGTEDFFKLFAFVAIGKLFFAIIIFTFVHEPKDYWYYNLALSLSQIISGVFLLLFPIIKYKIYPATFHVREVIAILKQKFSLFKGGTLVNFCMNINITILGVLLSLSDFGLYMAANKLILVVFTLVTLPLSQSLLPYISRSISENLMVALERIRYLMVPFLTYYTIAFCVILFVFTKLIILVMLGPQFLASTLLLKFMAFSLIGNVMTNVIILQLFIKLNYLTQYARITQLSAALSVAVTFLLTLGIGVNGAAIAWLISEFFIFWYSARQLKHEGVMVFDIQALHPRSFMSYWSANKFNFSENKTSSR